jgi:molecular chaperone DnaK (HSP70)
MDLTTLKAICRELRIKAESIDIFDDKEAVVQMIFKYRGTTAERYINEWDDEKVRRLKAAIKDRGEEVRNAKMEIPANFKIYKGIESLNERGNEHKVYTEADIDMSSAALVDQKGNIKAFINVSKAPIKNTFYLQLREHMLYSGIAPGIYKDFRILFFPNDFERVLRIYDLVEEVTSRFKYISKTVQEVVIHEVEETDDVLVIDYGTSYTTAGTYINEKMRHVWFYSEDKCEHNPEVTTHYAECRECGRCALCPSVIAVRECEEGQVDLMFGHEAKDHIPMARNSIFYDTKRWVNDYNEFIDVKDLVGNTASIPRRDIIERFMDYLIHTAEQQNKVRYKNICFTSPVKQKAMSISMYKDILRNYKVDERDAIDEAVAVVYDSVTWQVENLEYDDGYEKSVLLIDCGGSTSDMVKCNYVITHQKKRSNIDIKVGYVNGDTNFGGNNLTYRIMQYLKIKLAQYYKKKPMSGIDSLLNITLYDVFEFIDKYGITAAYESFEQAYIEAGNSIPTNYDDYVNDAETIYFNVRGNFYFLWNLAERIKVALYSSSGAYEYSFSTLKANRNLYMISVRTEKGAYMSFTEWPPIRILRDEINVLLKPEIYNIIKRFIEPYYKRDETMSDINNIMLSGQTTKIEIFRDVLKEYIAGHKARAPFEHSYSKKLKCIRGAVAYHGAKAIGRIRPSIMYASAIVPYYLTVETFNEDKEKTLIFQGQRLCDVYSYIDRTYETKLITFCLRNHNRDVLQLLKFNLNVDDYRATDYHELLNNYSWLKQGDVDRIDEGEVRLFVYSTDESWGFKWMGIAKNNDELFCGEEQYVPFESTVWELNFFDGKR